MLDLYGGHAVAALGYHSRWLAALERQARSLLFQSNAVPLDIRARCDSTREIRGFGPDTVLLINTGAEANEMR